MFMNNSEEPKESPSNLPESSPMAVNAASNIVESHIPRSKPLDSYDRYLLSKKGTWAERHSTENKPEQESDKGRG
jgi:hypothetical protein